MDIKFDDEKLLDLIKMISYSRGLSLQKLLTILVEKKNWTIQYPSFYNKLKNRTLKFDEMKDIVSVLNYEFFIKDNKS